jgi:hypothetical protein
MVSSKQIYEKLDEILSLPNWEDYQDIIEQLTIKLNELEENTKHSKETTRARDRRFNGRIRRI